MSITYEADGAFFTDIVPNAAPRSNPRIA